MLCLSPQQLCRALFGFHRARCHDEDFEFWGFDCHDQRPCLDSRTLQSSQSSKLHHTLNPKPKAPYHVAVMLAGSRQSRGSAKFFAVTCILRAQYPVIKEKSQVLSAHSHDEVQGAIEDYEIT